MQVKIFLIFLLCLRLTISNAQNSPTPSININDPAPLLRVSQWIKGVPIQRFEKDHVYVLEFWATWCKPCIAAMPHLSELAREYKGKATFIGIDIYESHLKSPKSISEVKAFVDSMGQKMDYHVAIEDSKFTVADWMEAAGEQGIPATFVVNGEGKIAWIGHPMELGSVLLRILNNSLDANKALAERNELRRLTELDRSLGERLNSYLGDPNKRHDFGYPDSALLLIDKIVQIELKLKYAPSIGYHTFVSLLKTSPQRAYEYGKQLLVTPSFQGTDYNNIIDPIKFFTEQSNLVTISPKIYELGGEAYQLKIDNVPFSSEALPLAYMEMADWFWRAKNKDKATTAAQKAIKAMKSEKEKTD